MSNKDAMIDEHNLLISKKEFDKVVKEMDQMVKTFKKASQEREKSYQRRDQSIINLMCTWQKNLSYILQPDVTVDKLGVVSNVRDNIRKLLRTLDYKGTF